MAAAREASPGKSASGSSPSTIGFPQSAVLRASQSKDILFGVNHHRAADSRECAVLCRGTDRARPPSETRRRVCLVSSGDQHRSSKKDSSIGEAAAVLCAGAVCGAAVCGGCVRCCVTRPRSRQGLSTASPLGTDLGKNVDRPRPRGQGGGQRCGAGHGQWRRWGDFGTRAAVR